MASSPKSAPAKRVSKRSRGRTDAESTPIAIRTTIDLPPGMAAKVKARLSARIGHAATLVERGTVRFEDVNGPRGGVDTVCRIKLVISGRPSVQVEGRGTTSAHAFTRALPRVAQAFERARGKHGLATGRARAPSATGSKARGTGEDPGELIGRRVGQGADALDRALARPEKVRRDALVDTAAKGTSESDRKAGGAATARRNSQARPSGTSALEDSRTRPSRKSTRRSVNRGKPSQAKERTAAAALVTPTARSRRAAATQRRR